MGTISHIRFQDNRRDDVTRETILNQIDQATIDLRHAQHAIDSAQNPSDKQYAASVADTHTRRLAALRVQERKTRR